jgi:hypothetical protein
MFADDQVIFTSDDDKMQWGLFELHKIAMEFNLIIPQQKTKVMAFYWKWPIRGEIILEVQTTKQLNTFNFLGCHISDFGETDISHKTERLNYICETILRTLKNKTRPDTQIKFYKTTAILTGLYGNETWVMSARDGSVAGLTHQDHTRN